MNQWTIRRSKMTTIRVGMVVVYSDGRRMVSGIVQRIDHDHYVICLPSGEQRRVLHEKVETLTTAGDTL